MNSRSKESNEQGIDLIFNNQVERAFWAQLGSPTIVECKNRRSPVGANELNSPSGKMDAISPDARTSILVSMKGITGNYYRDVQSRRRGLRRKRHYVLVLDKADLDGIFNCASQARVIEEKNDKLMLI
jgi:hypothetical protein